MLPSHLPSVGLNGAAVCLWDYDAEATADILLLICFLQFFDRTTYFILTLSTYFDFFSPSFSPIEPNETA